MTSYTSSLWKTKRYSLNISHHVYRAVHKSVQGCILCTNQAPLSFLTLFLTSIYNEHHKKSNRFLERYFNYCLAVPGCWLVYTINSWKNAASGCIDVWKYYTLYDSSPYSPWSLWKTYGFYRHRQFLCRKRVASHNRRRHVRRIEFSPSNDVRFAAITFVKGERDISISPYLLFGKHVRSSHGVCFISRFLQNFRLSSVQQCKTMESPGCAGDPVT